MSDQRDLRDDGFGNFVPVSETPPAASDDGLQFGTVEPAATESAAQSGSACQACGRGLGAEYFEVNAAMVCGDCVEEIRRSQSPAGSRVGRFSRALFAGAGVAILGSIVWYAVGKITGYELSLIAIAIGWGVGKAVHWGSGHRGGWRYQAIAVVLTYLSIVGSYIPQIAEQLSALESGAVAAEDGAASSTGEGADAVPATEVASEDGAVPGPLELVLGLVALLVIAMAAPFFAGFENIMGLLIIAIGLWQAWAMNRRPKIEISGPFLLGSRSPA